MINSLDEALANGIGVLAGLSPGRWARGKRNLVALALMATGR